MDTPEVSLIPDRTGTKPFFFCFNYIKKGVCFRRFNREMLKFNESIYSDIIAPRTILYADTR